MTEERQETAVLSASAEVRHGAEQNGREQDRGLSDPHRWWYSRLAVAIGLPILIFLILRPESYGLTPNASDPIFYTGYAINFDDILRELGDNRYFVTRWSSYLPSRVFSDLAGPVVGRLLLRWIIASGLVLCLLHLGRRWSWTTLTGTVVAATALASPLFARPFFTDYQEWIIVSLGTILLCQALEARTTVPRSIAIGVLAALLLIANPIVTYMVAAAVLVYGWYTVRRGSGVIVHMLLVAGSAVGVVLFGLFLFRFAYDVPNVYQPSIDFARARIGVTSNHRSPRLDWLGRFLWIYWPVVLVTVTFVVRPIRTLMLARPPALAAFVLLSAQYLLQWFDQFVRGGIALEVSYYWSAIVPSLTLATAVFVGAVQWTRLSAGIFLGAWVGVLALGRYSNMDLPSMPLYILVCFVLVAVCWQAGRWSVSVVVGMTAVFGLLAQVASPAYRPFEYHPFDDSPNYGSVFFSPSDSESSRDLDEILWLEDRLDSLPSDVNLFFAPSASATNLTGIYAPIVTHKLLYRTPQGDLDARALDRLASGEIDRLAIYGEEPLVESTVRQLEAMGVPLTPLLDDVNPRGHNHRLFVVRVGGWDLSG